MDLGLSIFGLCMMVPAMMWAAAYAKKWEKSLVQVSYLCGEVRINLGADNTKDMEVLIAAVSKYNSVTKEMAQPMETMQ